MRTSKLSTVYLDGIAIDLTKYIDGYRPSMEIVLENASDSKRFSLRSDWVAHYHISAIVRVPKIEEYFMSTTKAIFLVTLHHEYLPVYRYHHNISNTYEECFYWQGNLIWKGMTKG